MTKFYKPLDLTVNGFSKCFMAWKVTDWYTGQVSAQLNKGVSIDETDIKLRLFLMKPLHAGWLLSFYNHMTSGTEKRVIDSGWISSGIKDAIALGLDSFSLLDPFRNTPPIADQSGSPPWWLLIYFIVGGFTQTFLPCVILGFQMQDLDLRAFLFLFPALKLQTRLHFSEL